MKPVIVDLFAGVGGMSLGAARAGFHIGAAFEWDRIALRAHALNFPKTFHSDRDVATLSGRELLDAAERPSISGLIGGPPCQGFSTIGKRLIDDPRNSLFGHFFRLVRESDPAFFVAENVPGILSPRNKRQVEDALAQVPSRYRLLPPRIVVASDFGVPTSRRRVFFVGYDPERLTDIDADELFAPLQYTVSVREALSGLPAVRPTWQSVEQGWRKVGEGITNNEFKERLKASVPEGVGDANALARIAQGWVSGNLGTVHESEVVRRFRAVKPGATDAISRAPRLNPNGFCPTLRAGTNSDRGSFQAVRPIHFSVPRVITPREAARLQGFPDWFQFDDTKWHSFRQIGNSVSPGVAEALLGRLKTHLRD